LPRPLSRPAARARLLAILALVAALFSPSLGNTFALDDRLIAKAVRDSGQPNAMVAELQPLGRYFTANYWQGVDDQDLLYRPLTVLSYALVYACAGRHLSGEHGEALPQHAINVVLHLVATWLVYLLARAVRAGRGAALLAALAFGVHAIHSEVVAGVVGRAELLAFAFGALGTLLAVHGLEGGKMRPGALAGAAAAWFAAFASKESAVAWAPFSWVLVFVRRLHDEPGAPALRLLRRGAPAAALAAGVPLALFLALRAHTLAKVGADAAAWEAKLEASTAGWRVGNAFVQWAYALLSSVLPVHLSADHGPSVFTPQTSLSSPSVLLSLVVLGGTLAGGLALWRRAPWLFLAAATFFGHSFLTSNVPLRIGTDYAERLYYTPSLALSFVVAHLAHRLGARWRAAAVVALASWVAWNGSLILRRNPVWRDDPTLFAAEVENQPRSARMHLFHAMQLQKRGAHAEAIAHLERVVELFPEHAEAWNHIGADHFRAGRHAQARACFERSVAAGHFTPQTRVAAAINLVAALLETGDLAAVPRALEVALAADPRAFAARVPDLRRTLTTRLPYEVFDGLLARAAAAAPEARLWDYDRAWLAHDRGRHAAAVAHGRRALAVVRSQPHVAELRLVVAAGLAATGDGAGARALLEEALADPTTPAALREQVSALRARVR